MNLIVLAASLSKNLLVDFMNSSQWFFFERLGTLNSTKMWSLSVVLAPKKCTSIYLTLLEGVGFGGEVGEVVEIHALSQVLIFQADGRDRDIICALISLGNLEPMLLKVFLGYLRRPLIRIRICCLGGFGWTDQKCQCWSTA